MSDGRGDIVALVPAAGSGSRMSSDVPKQYLQLDHESVLMVTLRRLRMVPAVSRIVVVVSDTQHQLNCIDIQGVSVTVGGDTRAASVLNGLVYIRDELKHTGRVMVHDAARPCVRVADINRLVTTVGDNEHGGILAVPVHDTLKRSDDKSRIVDTVDRNFMWRAVTPQLFMIGKLIQALEHARANDVQVTDEASAMEYAGYQPTLVSSAQDNIKITVADDLVLARTILNAQENK